VSCAIEFEFEFEFASVASTFADFVIVIVTFVIVAVIDSLYSFNARQRLESQYFLKKLARIVSVSTIECDRVRSSAIECDRVRLSGFECDRVRLIRQRSKRALHRNAIPESRCVPRAEDP